ncbi:MAG: hypothetical protein JNM63_14290 [Spirochaetia bacterium]|nr:hypothetical protein [Spirochaetia bacterium]
MRKYMEHVNEKIKALEAEIQKLRKAKDTAGVKVSEAKLNLYLALWDDEPVSKRTVVGSLQFKECCAIHDLIAALSKFSWKPGKNADKKAAPLKAYVQLIRTISDELEKLGAPSISRCSKDANPTINGGYSFYFKYKT